MINEGMIMENQREWAELKKELRMTRIFCVVSALLTAGLLLAIILLSIRIQPLIRYAEETRPVLDSLAALDVEAVNGTLNQLENVDLKALADSINELDMSVVNETLEQVDSALEDMDVEALSTAIQNLNSIVESLKSVSSKISNFFGSIG